MKKSKLKLLVIIVAILTLLTFSYTYADDENLLISGENNVEIDDATDNSYQDEKIVSSDVYILEKNDVLIDYIVEGNAYIIADSVTINSQINGDLFVITNNLNIGTSGYINNVFAISKSINIDGFVSTLYTCANDLTLNDGSYIYRDVYAMVNSFNVFGIIERNANVAFDNISFKSNNEDESYSGKISGDLNYVSSNEAKIDNNSVKGNINFTQKADESTSKTQTVFDYLLSLVTKIATVFAIYFIISWLAPKFKETSKELLQKKSLPVLGFGALGLFAIPIVTILLLLISIGSTLALALLAIYILLLCIASAIFIIALSEVLIEKFNFEDKIKKLGILSALSIAYWLIKLIPILGGLASFVAVLLGFGLIIKAILKK